MGEFKETRIVALTVQPELLDPFIRTVSEPTGPAGFVTIPEVGELRIDAVVAFEMKTPHGAELLDLADACIVLVRHVDRESLENLRTAIRLLPTRASRNLHVMLCRNTGEAEFKMSCPKCGQKLMVQDALAFRRVLCPRCREPFTIPGQIDLLRSELVLQPSRLVRKVVIGDAASCRHALTAMVQQLAQESDAAKAQTMHLDLSSEDVRPEPVRHP